MTTQLEVLNEFIEDGGVLFEHIFESSVVDAYLYEDEYFTAAIDKYVEMLDNDNIDEKFEEQLSTVLAPYFVATTPFYENLIIQELSLKSSIAMGKAKGAASIVNKGRSGKKGARQAQKVADKFASGKLPKGQSLAAKLGKKALAAPGKAVKGIKGVPGALVAGGKNLMKKVRSKYGKKYVRGMLKAAGKKAWSIAKATPGAPGRAYDAVAAGITKKMKARKFNKLVKARAKAVRSGEIPAGAEA